jgi:hypothetical protein
MGTKMTLNDQDKITIGSVYFIRPDQRRPDILELFHEDAEVYFPKFGFGFGRHSLFELVHIATLILLGMADTSAPTPAEIPTATLRM